MLPKFPAQAAGPSEIRTYILQVLMTQDGTTSEVANEIANLWRVGRGSELRDASVQLFKEIFGSYTGWFLYRIVHEEILADWKRSTVGIISFHALIIAIVISIFVVLRRLVPYIFKGSVPESSEKGASPIFQALLFLGLSMINYGLLTPSSNGDAIAIAGSMVSLPAGVATLICQLIQAAEQKEGKHAPVGNT